MIEWLETVDRALFMWLNGCHHPFLDTAMVIISHKLTWIPLYLVLAVLAQRKWGWKGFGVFLVLAAVTVTLTDQTSVKLFKEIFERYRPCHNLEIKHLVHIVDNHCGGMYGFVSSHAANHFGIAAFMGLTLFRDKKRGLAVMLIWAALVAYSRIYLGVHYPADIVGGGILGGAIGWSTAKLYNFIHEQYLQS